MGTPDSRLDPTDRQRSLFRKLQIRKWSSDTIEMVPGLIGAYQAYAGLLCAARKGDPIETTATARGDGEASLESAARQVVQELFACRCILTKQTRQIRSTRESIEDGGVSTLSGNEIQAVLHSTFARGFLCCPGIAEAIGPLHALLLEPAAQSCEKTSPNRSEGEMKQERPDDRAPTTERGPDPPAWTWSRCQEQRLRSVAKPPPSRRFTVLDTARRPSRKQKQKLPASAAAAAPVDPMAELQRWRWWASSQRLCAERMRPHSERLRRQLVERMAEQEEARKRLMATRKNALQQHLRQLLLQTNPFADARPPIRLAKPAANTTETRQSGWPADERMPPSCRLCRCRHHRGEALRQPVAPTSTTAAGPDGSRGRVHVQDSSPDANEEIRSARLRLLPETMSLSSCFRIAKRRLPSPAALQTTLAALLRAAKGPLSASMTTTTAVFRQQMHGLLQNTSSGRFHDGLTRRLAAANRTGHGLPRLSASESSLKSCREEKSVRRQKKDPGYIVNDPRLFFGHYY
ncbi:hypothetical protein CMQ_7312 [Grosmannia clavigera kw1407]|uniref:Uncharacterized protein n=1 Tax=Grosmannia clavigera (strain kw1407 / UAMH 11150) TaxID=655863 RepID=F0XP48_GROCL|nr:uncharacterized protein CMQ_7312 [Grosmannia clavigera kw1407]EFX00310.1 hypothetical protein CMQ_7312 [Grosmannia clavigera kw1407]